ncbi:MAG: DUF2188 domain-containing protein [Lamprocystis purpurea]|jgi:hypothetical protein|uniref:DUF2188 domain-containing protein n=1 Tax=Lamprocystis purpurea TaxID=61598 RepID=UPI0009FC7F8C|nr:DUF2188 domain-containing protein [Lamprocystis purpurea]MBV5272123.1 DUF2188 domain-containing protein [Lamprocystis purpurea]
MNSTFSVTKDGDGTWVTRDTDSGRTTKAYLNKSEAMVAARAIAKSGGKVIIHGVQGDVQDVIGVKDASQAGIRKAPVRRRLSSRDVNIAIAKVLEKG